MRISLRTTLILLALALNAAMALWAAAPVKKTAAKKPAAKAATSSKKSSNSKTAASKSAKAKKPAKQAASRFRRSTQREPAPERYQEIQQALADKGYFPGPVNGNWGPDSVAALKRFQRDQNIGDDGKLGSLSLIALGLGPKRGTPSAPAP